MLIKWITAQGALALTLHCFVGEILTLQIQMTLAGQPFILIGYTDFRLQICAADRNATAPSTVITEVIYFCWIGFTFIDSKGFVMKIILTDSSRSMKDSEWASCSKCWTEMKFFRSKLYSERTGSFLAFGLSQEK